MNNFAISIILTILCFTLQAQSSKVSTVFKKEWNSNPELNYHHLHSFGVSIVNQSNPLEFNYEFHILDRLSLRVGVQPINLIKKDFFEIASTAGMRYSLVRRGNYEFSTGLDYYYSHFDGDDSSWRGDLEITSHTLEVPLQIKYHASSNYTFNLSMSPGYLMAQERSDLKPIEDFERFNKFGRFRFGMQKKFGHR